MKLEIFCKSLFIPLFLICFGSLASAQEKEDLGTEVVNVVKPYDPSISDAFKINENPTERDTLRKIEVPQDYKIYSVPVASTFIPAKVSPKPLTQGKKEKLYNSYASLGLGNYGNALADFYTSLALSRVEQLDVNFNHISSLGGITEIPLDDGFLHSGIGGSYYKSEKDWSWSGKAGYDIQIFNWYGIPEFGYVPEVINAVDPSHTFHSIYAKGGISLPNSYFSSGELFLRGSWDSKKSDENWIRLTPSFIIPIGESDINAQFEAEYLTGGFESLEYNSIPGLNYSFLKLGMGGDYRLGEDRWSARLGAKVYYLNDGENSDSKFFIYPDLDFSLEFIEEYAILFGGIRGQLTTNTYYDLFQINPYLAPSLTIRPTDKQYEIFAGLKGKLLPQVSYHVQAGYQSEKDKALFKASPFVFPVYEDFLLGNSFYVAYDDVNTIEVQGGLSAEVGDAFQIELSGSYYNYNTDVEDKAWNLPELRAQLSASYTLMKKLNLGLQLFYVGSREDQRILVIEPLQPVVTNLSLDGYLDFNAKAIYHLNNRLSIFARLNNIIGDNYDKWLDFPVQGFQVIGGLSYQFDLGN